MTEVTRRGTIASGEVEAGNFSRASRKKLALNFAGRFQIVLEAERTLADPKRLVHHHPLDSLGPMLPMAQR